jgi:ATP-dependent Clp protease ATP-binding subunit ClpC
MAGRFNKFTERARKVVEFAQEEAQRLNHNYIGTEHLLLGLVREDEGVAAKVLGNLGVQFETSVVLSNASPRVATALLLVISD